MTYPDNDTQERNTSQAPLPQLGRRFSHRAELLAAVLCRHSEFEVQEAHDACRIDQATRRCQFTHLLTYYP